MRNILILGCLVVVSVGCVEAVDHDDVADPNRRGSSDQGVITTPDADLAADAGMPTVDTNPLPACPGVYPNFYSLTTCTDAHRQLCEIDVTLNGKTYVTPVVDCVFQDVLCVQSCK